ncbi:DUF1642 domain-containing protein [Listeria monocytogenes]|nr:DUF1642 domain-containing protein [Listeria monocytogenes]EHN2765729.1 DUF1642 domain-containing protein [Listeria monocytogenes]EHR8634986.1 DUF1642 domain-containing protein [Listeria monocytogenes]EHX3134265.1 DUF1642 domain-containing protein [Listeria monocytogenes]
MNFEIGDKVNFICRGEICTGAILDFGKKAILVEYTTGDRAGWRVWVRESELALVKLPVVPRYVAEWIMKGKLRDKSLLRAIDIKSSDMWNVVCNWLEDNTENQYLFARAWMEGYEVEKAEPLYYVKLGDSGLDYLNFDERTEKKHVSHKEQSPNFRVKFTEQEIKAIDERYWQFKVPVSELEETR